MQADRIGAEYSVSVDKDDVVAFMRSWPCSGLDADASYRFVFSASNGDLVDLTVTRGDGHVDTTESEDGPALLALSEDAGRFGAEELGLEEVIAIRFPTGPSI